MNEKIKKAIELVGDLDFDKFFEIVKTQTLPTTIESIDYGKIDDIKFKVENSIWGEFDNSPSKESVIVRIAELLISNEQTIRKIKGGDYFFNIELLGRLWVYSDVIRNYVKTEGKFLSESHKRTKELDEVLEKIKDKYNVEVSIGELLFITLEIAANEKKSIEEKINHYKWFYLYYEKQSLMFDTIKDGTDKEIKEVLLPLINNAIRSIELDYEAETAKVIANTNQMIVKTVEDSIERLKGSLGKMDSIEKKIEFIRLNIKEIEQQIATPITPSLSIESQEGFLKPVPIQIKDWLTIELDHLTSETETNEESKSFIFGNYLLESLDFHEVQLSMLDISVVFNEEELARKISTLSKEHYLNYEAKELMKYCDDNQFYLNYLTLEDDSPIVIKQIFEIHKMGDSIFMHFKDLTEDIVSDLFESIIYYSYLKGLKTSKVVPSSVSRKVKKSYNWHNKSDLKEFYDLLINESLISNETTLEQIVSIFSSQPIDRIKPIRWHDDTASEVLYLILKLEDFQCIERGKRSDYERLTACFVDIEGLRFSASFKEIKQSIYTTLSENKRKKIDALVKNF